MATKFVRVRSKGGPAASYLVSEAAFNAFPDRYEAVEDKPQHEESEKTSGDKKKEETK